MRRCSLLAGAAAALVLGCASLPPRIERPPSYAIDDDTGTALATLAAPALAAHKGASGYALLDDDRQAATVRMVLAEVAARTIDVQTYGWSGDVIGRVLWSQLTRAAERGVRVRILVDDMMFDGQRSRLPERPNLEVRVFNPLPGRRLFRVLELARHFAVLNRRMHNKLFIVDDAAVIVGGRNIGDEYFGLDDGHVFHDLDVLSIGPVVQQASSAFDEYWNSRWAWPIAALVRRTREAEARLERHMRAAALESIARYPYPLDLGEAKSLALLAELREHMSWGPGEVLYDSPARMAGEDGDDSAPARAMGALEALARREVVVESAYFVPHPDLPGVRALRRRGVTVRVLTNSLDSTDHVSVHVGYQRTRRSLVESGVELYELRPDAAIGARQHARPSRRGTVTLHAKVAVLDREWVVIGSRNLDPRSRYLDTEVVLAAHSPALAQRTLAAIAPDFALDSAWRVALGDRGGVVWIAREHGRIERSGFEPASLLRSLSVIVLSLLPLEDLI
jgi:putative cardiolipin synthase